MVRPSACVPQDAAVWHNWDMERLQEQCVPRLCFLGAAFSPFPFRAAGPASRPRRLAVKSTPSCMPPSLHHGHRSLMLCVVQHHRTSGVRLCGVFLFMIVCVPQMDMAGLGASGRKGLKYINSFTEIDQKYALLGLQALRHAFASRVVAATSRRRCTSCSSSIRRGSSPCCTTSPSPGSTLSPSPRFARPQLRLALACLGLPLVVPMADGVP